MAHEFKPGDLALIVGYKSTPKNVGKTCELLAFLKPGDCLHFPHVKNGKRRAGLCNKADRAGWIVTGDTLIGKNIPGVCLVWPGHLMPLKGDEQPAQVRQAERVQ